MQAVIAVPQPQQQMPYVPQVGDVTHLVTIRVYEKMKAKRFFLVTEEELQGDFHLAPEEAKLAFEELIRNGWQEELILLMAVRIHERMRNERLVLGTERDLRVRFQATEAQARIVLEVMTRMGWVQPYETGRKTHTPQGPGNRSLGDMPKLPGAFRLCTMLS